MHRDLDVESTQGRLWPESSLAALQDMAAQRFAAAERNFKMAMTYEPGNVNYKAKAAEVAKLVKSTDGLK